MLTTAILSGLVGFGAFLGFGRLVMFKDWDEFGEAFWYWFKPDFWSFLQGEGMEDWWAELKLFLTAAVGVACGCGLFFQAGPALRAWFGAIGLP